MRKSILAANWKMNKTVQEALAFVETFKALVQDAPKDREIVLIPPFLSIAAVGSALAGTAIDLGAQNMHQEPGGAYTGEISTAMLVAQKVLYVVIGHSERRQFFHETNQSCNAKIHAAFQAGLVPIYCIGETLEQREGGITLPLMEIQVREGLTGLSARQASQIVIAYEPVWAIGTGKTATTDQTQEVHGAIRHVLKGVFDESVSQAVRIQYGGSVKPSNVDDLMSMPDIDGALVGGAGLEPESFARIALYK